MVLLPTRHLLNMSCLTQLYFIFPRTTKDCRDSRTLQRYTADRWAHSTDCSCAPLQPMRTCISLPEQLSYLMLKGLKIFNIRMYNLSTVCTYIHTYINIGRIQNNTMPYILYVLHMPFCVPVRVAHMADPGNGVNHANHR